MPSINDVIYKSQLPKYVELFDIDCTKIPNINAVFRLTSNFIDDNTLVQFNGQQYSTFPIAISGISQKSDGAYPRPILSISNINGDIGRFVLEHEDIIGAKVFYYRTFEIYLRSNSSVCAPPFTFFVGRKTAHTKTTINWELRHTLDRERTFLPARQMLKKDFPGLGDYRHIG